MSGWGDVSGVERAVPGKTKRKTGTMTETETICSACMTEACAAGILLCEDARRAGILRRARGDG